MGPRPPLLLALLVALSGCVGPAVPVDCGTGEPEEGAPGHEVFVYLGNERPEAVCLEVRLDGRLVVARQLPAAEPAGEYSLVRSLEWPDASVRVRASDGDVVAHATVDLSREGYLVVVRDGNGIRIDALESEPAFM